ncbi:MAG: aminotransferase class I/II-fold pyridoxal phosphate-dependent enzyme [Saprospiraceae bacterium]|nr:aminotransferase class I/II-fold pyridoxal phosphate-dependent enzyme [Saprospiraceae bacterium]
MKEADHTQETIRLNFNENCYGCSPLVRAGVEGVLLKELHLYPSAPVRLETELARRFGLNLDQVIAGAGSVRLIDGLIQTLVDETGELLIFENSFVAYEQLAQAHSKNYRLIPQSDFICDPQAILDALTPQTHLVFLANPNNPTGTFIAHDQLEQLLVHLPTTVFLALDEAYVEYVTDPAYPDALALLKRFPNLIVLRSFSKMYGLAALRIGYALADAALCRAMKKKQIPFSINRVAEEAALIALEDQLFVEYCKKENETGRNYLWKELTAAGFHALPSQGNFIYLHFDHKGDASNAASALARCGILVSDLPSGGPQGALRIGVGDQAANSRVVECLRSLPPVRK